MTDPDDDWGDLARELGVQKSAASADNSPAAEEPAAVEEEEFTDAVAADETPEEAAEDEADGEPTGEEGGEEPAGDEPPGPGRKRRRRRRRRKKGGPEGEGEPADAGIADEPAPSYQAAARAPVAPVAAPAAVGRGVNEDEPDAEDGEVGGAVPAAEEDTAGEVLRELIATWNVPSWDEIISGLHRP